MPNPQDQVMLLLGQLKADMESSQRQRKDLFDKVDALVNTTVKMASDLSHHMDVESNLLTEYHGLSKRVSVLETLKTRIIAMWAVIAFLGATLLDPVRNWLRGM